MYCMGPVVAVKEGTRSKAGSKARERYQVGSAKRALIKEGKGLASLQPGPGLGGIEGQKGSV